MRMIGASVIGPLHLKTATPCQDAYAYKILDPETGIIAVADGLGSAEFSDFGARHAVDAAVSSAKVMLCGSITDKQSLEGVVKNAVFSARHTLEAKAMEYKCKLRDLACTLIVVVMHKGNTIVAHIGDGAVVTKTDIDMALFSAPADSEYANEVSPLTGNDWESSIKITFKNSPILALMVFTDGLQRAALKRTPDGVTPFERFCSPLFSFAQEAEDFQEAENDIKTLLSSTKVCDNSEDDKTVVIAVLENGGEALG